MQQRLLLILFATLGSLFAEAPVSVAVADFAARGVAANDAAAMADRFSAELSAAGKFQVIERSRLSEIVRETALQQAVCSDPACATDLGKLLAAKKIVLGSVSKVGGIFSVTVRFVNVETGQIEQNLSEDCDCGIEELLTATLRRMARKLAGVTGSGEGAIVSLQKGEASVFVKSIPDSARVLVDGRIMDGVTPLTVQGIPSGRHDIRVQKGNLAATTIVSLGARQIKKLQLTLRQQETALKVLTNPSEAEVYVNAQPTRSRGYDQLTPAVFESPKGDRIRLTLFKPGFLDSTFTVVLSKNTENMVSVDMKAGDPEYLKLQNRFLSQRMKRRVGFRLSLASVLLAAGGTTSVLLAQKDYRDATDAKNRLDQAAILSGPDYERDVALNKKKNDAGNLKSTLGYGLLGAGTVGLGAGLYFYFF
ncbi:MAG: PEGA domain-containing protein [Fibrobacterota bacterium]